MCLVPSRQFYPTTSTFLDSFHSSFSIYHGSSSRLQFFRCHSFLPSRMQNFYATHGSKTSIRAPEQNLLSKFSCVFKEPSRVKPDSGLYDSRGSWLDKWNEYGKQTRLKEPRAMVSYQDGGSAGICAVGDETNSSHRAGGSTMEKIVEKLKKFGYIDGVDKRKGKEEKVIEKGSVEDIFYVEEGMLPNTQGGFSGKVVLGDGGVIRFPWEKSVEREGGAAASVMKKNRTSLAELTLPESELERLRYLAIRTKNKTKIGGAGVTQALVDTIHEQWKTSEVVRLKIEGPPALNMKRMHEILERKTGGLVIWRSGTSIALYRGVSFEDLSLKLKIQRCNRNEITRNSSSETNDKIGSDSSVFGTCSDLHPSQLKTETTAEDKNDAEPLPEVNYEDEVNQLLDDLGPRYTDWPGYDPIPVDADMLAGDIPGYKPPFRLLPYGVKGNLGEKEATALRRLARGLPPHFALGRGRKLHGLAVAMIKLWEKSMISKIALKRGVQLTTSEKMAEDLKKLTGGVLLSRNKDFLVFYRGKNFLSSKVTEALLERERSAKALQDDEEKARLKASEMVAQSVEKIDQSGAAGTLGETLDADARWAKKLDDHDKAKMMREAKLIRHVNLVRDLECKLAFAERKVIRAERALSKIDESLKPSEWSTDMGSISDEERFMFRKLGLKMKAYLLLGRRGVFDGTVENMHLHWKYRELVKIILKLRNFHQVEKIALSLEAESGGVLVSVDKISKGYAIIVYRGKDYKRPPALRPKNLLTKRKALARSIELQRHEALSRHVSVLQRRVAKLKSEMEQSDVLEDQEGNDELYDKLDSAYPTDEEETQDEGDGTYLETYGKEREVYEEDERSESVNNGDYQTSFPYDANYHKPESRHGVYKQQLHLVTDNIASTRAGEDEENIQLYMNRANL